MLFIMVFSKLMYVITPGKSHLRNKWLSTKMDLPWGLAQTSIIWILDLQTILILRTKLLNYTELHQQQKEHQTTSTTLNTSLCINIPFDKNHKHHIKGSGVLCPIPYSQKFNVESHFFDFSRPQGSNNGPHTKESVTF